MEAVPERQAGSGDSAALIPSRLATRRSEHFVGRAAELDAFRRSLALVANGERVVACVTGEPGIGKTRLAAEVAGLAGDAGVTVLYGRAEDAVGIAYQPFVDALGEYEAAARSGSRFHTATGHDLIERMLAAGDPGSIATASAFTEPGSERYVLFGAVTAAIAAIASDGPVALVLDDLHWASEATVLMLRHVVERTAGLPLLLILAWRATDVDDDHPLVGLVGDLAGEPRIERCDLTGLDDEAVAACVAHFVGDLDPQARAAVAGEVAERTAGNPLFVGELLRHVAERDGGRAAAGGSIAAYGWPATGRDVVRQRVSRLGEDAVRALEAASVVGGPFDAELIAACTGFPASGVQDCLDRAVEAGLLVPAGTRGTALVFVHVLVSGALYDSLTPHARGRIHRVLAQTLTEHVPAVAPALVAWHWQHADPADDERTLAAAITAGQAALGALSPHEGLRWFTEAVAAAGRRGGEDRQTCAALLGLGEAERDTGEPAYRETLLRAARLALVLGDDDQLVRAALANHRGFASSTGEVDGERLAMLEAALSRVDDDDVLRARVLATVAAELSFSGDWDRRVAAADAAVEAARVAGDPATLSRVLSARFVPLWMPQTLAARVTDTQEAVRQADRTDSPAVQFEAVHWRTAGLIESARLAEADAAARRQNVLADQLGHPTALWMATYDRANLAIIHGRLRAAEEFAGAALAIATASRQPDAMPFYASQLANIRYEQGRLGELQELLAQVVTEHPGIPAFRALLALSLCESNMSDQAAGVLAAEAADDFARIPTDVTWLSTLAIFAEVCARVGTRSVADLLDERLAPWGDHLAFTGVGSWGIVHHLLGRLAARRSEHDLALERFARAERVIAGIDAPIWAARLCADEAEVRGNRGAPGDRELATALVDRAINDARRLGAAGIERRAVALEQHLRALDALGGVLPAQPAAHAALAAAAIPAREPVAELVCEGDVWRVSHDGTEFRLSDSRGMQHLGRLLAQPGFAFSAIELGAGAPGLARPGAAAAGLTVRRADDGVGPALDDQAKQAYRERIAQLRADLDEAESFNDPERAARLREELEFVASELASAVGLGGRDRPNGSDGERARVNVTRAIRRAISRIGEHDRPLARELDSAVRTGALCVYEPPPHLRLQWRVELPEA